jgi:hypothetical protein
MIEVAKTMLITKTSLHRRTFLRGMGTTLALPVLDAMVPALSALKDTAAKPVQRFGAVYIGNGANMSQWTPATEGVGFEFSPILKPLEAFRDRVLVVTGLDNWPAMDQGDTGGQHSRAGVAFMSAAHPKQTEGADVRAGATIDQIAAQELCKDSKLPSLELALDRIDVVGACEHRYACAYVNSVSWRTPTMPLPMETNPRFVFERLFGSGDTTEERLVRSQEDRSILDVVTKQISRLRGTLGARDNAKLSEYLDAIRDVERRIERVEADNTGLDVPERPTGVPSTVKEHAALMFDLQVLAFQADITRVCTLMLAREISSQTYPEIGLPDGHHSISHHGTSPEKQASYAKLNAYHVQMFADFLEKLQTTSDGDGTLLDHSLLLYGSGMSEGNTHNNLNVPVLVVGGAGAHIRGGRHVRYAKGTPLSNLSLTLLDKVGVPLEKFGDSTGRLDFLSGV